MKEYKFPYDDPPTEKEIKEFVKAAKEMIEDAKKTASPNGLEVADLIVKTAVGMMPKFSSEKHNKWFKANNASVLNPEFLNEVKSKESELEDFFRSPLNFANVISTAMQLGLFDDLFKEDGENLVSYKDLMNHVVFRQLANLLAHLYENGFKSAQNVVNETKKTFFKGYVRAREDILAELGEDLIKKGWDKVFVTLYTGKSHERPEVAFYLHVIGSLAALTHGKRLGVISEKESEKVEKAKEEGVLYAVKEGDKLEIFAMAPNLKKLFNRLGVVIGRSLAGSKDQATSFLPPLLSKLLIENRPVALAFVKGVEKGRNEVHSTEGMILDVDGDGVIKLSRTGMPGGIENRLVKIGKETKTTPTEKVDSVRTLKHKSFVL